MPPQRSGLYKSMLSARPAKQTTYKMWLIILLVISVRNAATSDLKESKAVIEQKFLPYSLSQSKDAETHYTLLTDSKDYERAPLDAGTAMQQGKPWRRLAYNYGFGQHQSGWHATQFPSFAMLAPLLSLCLPGLLMIGINLGGLLYMVLGLLGLGQHRAWNTPDFYRSNTQDLGSSGKDASIYY